MEQVEDKYQRRAIVGKRHFVLADPQQPDRWALPGPVVDSVDALGLRNFGAARTVSTETLAAWARSLRCKLRIEERFPVVRRNYDTTT